MTAPLTPPIASPASPASPPPASPASQPPAPHLRTRRIITVPPRPNVAAGASVGDLTERAPRTFTLLGSDDLAWIAELIDFVAGLAGEPWRIALDAIEGGTWRRTTSDDREPPAIPLRRLDAASTALRRLLTGRPHDAELARNARALLLGAPALDDAARASRISAVAAMLALTPAALERVLWADVPRERPIELPHGRPTATEVAALANVGLLQRALARARSLELVIRGDASPLLRGCAARGLIVTASERESASDANAPSRETVSDANTPSRETASDANAPSRETVLDITGPLALCHGTAVYGRALGSLVPLLASCEAFALTVRAETYGQIYEVRVESPALLPASAVRSWALVERLAKDLERLGARHGIRVRRQPPALVQPPPHEDQAPHGGPAPHGGALACPDLGVELGDRVIWIEVVGFWTPEYLARKLARYRAVGAPEVVLCVDSTRACDDDDPPAGACVMRFARRVHAEPLLQLLGLPPPD